MKLNITIICCLLCMLYIFKKCKVYMQYSTEDLYNKYKFIRTEIIHVIFVIIMFQIVMLFLDITILKASTDKCAEMLYKASELLENVVLKR